MYSIGLGYLELFLVNNGSTGYAVSKSLTYTDFDIYSTLWWIKSGNLDGIPTSILDNYPNIIKLYENVDNHPKVKQWYE